jgi:hypothetical protein
MVDLAEPNISQKLLSVKILFGVPERSFIIAVIRSFRRILSISHFSLIPLIGGSFRDLSLNPVFYHKTRMIESIFSFIVRFFSSQQKTCPHRQVTETPLLFPTLMQPKISPVSLFPLMQPKELEGDRKALEFILIGKLPFSYSSSAMKGAISFRSSAQSSP